MSNNDTIILQDLAKQYADIANNPIQDERRDLWRTHNSLKPTRPPIYIRAFAWREMEESKCLCKNPILRQIETQLRYKLFWNSLNDDSIFEPWITVPAVQECTDWGIKGSRVYSDEDDGAGAYKEDYVIKELDDINKLIAPKHKIDQTATANNLGQIHDAIGDIITLNLDRGPYWRMWGSDIATHLGHLRGIENIMMDMMDNPEWLHSLVKFLSDSILSVQAEAEAAGDWGLCDHENQAMTYTEELEDPAANTTGIKRKQLWGYMAAQELTAVSPAMHDEFLLQYQIPILKEFGLASYGCCEDLTNKIDILRQIPNLRRIAVSPFADAKKCAEQIGTDYVISYRPSPADMVSYGWNEERIRKILTRDLEACKGTYVDITLKDVETVEKDPNRIREWVKLTRNIIDEVL